MPTQPKLEPAPAEGTRNGRRVFTGEYKARILAECDAASKPGDIGAILRREGLYSSHLVDWRLRRAEGALAGLAPRPVGRPRKSAAARAEQEEVLRLRREVEVLQEKLRRAELVMDAQKKLSMALDALRTCPESSESSE